MYFTDVGKLGRKLTKMIDIWMKVAEKEKEKEQI